MLKSLAVTTLQPCRCKNLILWSLIVTNYVQALDLTFSIDLCIEEGGGSVELIQGGRDVEVTSGNIYQYVRKYAHHRMVSLFG